MAKAKLMHRIKYVYTDGAILQIVIWQLPSVSPERKHGLKYSLYFGDACGKCFVRYDNESGKGDHKHIAGCEEPYIFSTIEKLVEDFKADMRTIRRSESDKQKD